MSAEPAGSTPKAAVRATLLRRRRDRAGDERAAGSAAVAVTLAARLAGTPVIAAFVPDATEAGSGHLPGALAAGGARVLLPVVPARGRQLDWAVHSGELVPGRFGLLEPPGPRLGPAAIGTAGAVVVPAVAVARDGARLGRGGGYYDRALRHARPGAVVVAVVFDDELVDRLPTEPHDARVTAVVTPSGGWQALPAGH